MSLKQFFVNMLGQRQRESIRRRVLVRQVAKGEPIREREIEAIRQVVGPGDHAADIGANVGLFTRELSSLVTSSGHVYAFEPVSNNYRILTAVIERARLSNVTPFNVALGEQPGERTIVVPDGDGFTGYYQAHFDEGRHEAGVREVVSTTSLDALHEAHALGRLDFVKCDVEGAEMQVLGGGRHLIRESSPSFMIEVSKRTASECFEFFRTLQYGAFVYDGRLRPTAHYLDGQFSNYFFFHPASKAMVRAESSRLFAG